MAMKKSWKMTLATLALVGWLGTRAEAQTPPNAAAPPPPPPPPPPAAATNAEVAVNPDANGNGNGGGDPWYLQAEFLYLRRDAPRRNISLDFGDRVTLVTTKELHFDFEPGFRLGIGYQCTPTWAVEASFFTTADWSNHQTIGALSTPFNGFAGSLFSGFSQFGHVSTAVFPFDGAQVNSLSYSASLHNLEVNLRHLLIANNNFVLNGIFGIRNVHDHERFLYTAVGTVDGLATSTPATGEYAVETNNDLFDFQLGGDLAYWCSDSLSLCGVGKMGWGVNRARERSAINGGFAGTLGSSVTTPFNVAAVSEHVGAAYSLEYGLFVNWKLSHGSVVRVGYQAIFLTNMALAPRQLNFLATPNAQLNTDHNGTIFLHGPSAGLEFTW
jgi:hypothetical protein